MTECTEQTLPSGEVVILHPPCDIFPEGHRVLVPSGSLRAKLEAGRADDCAAHAVLKQADQDRLHKAQESLSAGESVPHEKRCI